MKRILVLALALAMCLGLASPAVAATMPPTKTKTYTLSADHINTEYAYPRELTDDVSVTVTLDGYLGELDMEACGITGEPAGPIYVLKSGSDVKFTITSDDADAYYNFCYEKAEFDMYTFDDWGGGKVWDWLTYDGKENIDWVMLSVSPNGDGTARMSWGNAVSRKINNNTYAYTATDGLYSFVFSAKDHEDWWNNEALARYNLGTFLFITEEQVTELEETGTMTFRSNWLVEFQHYYPGLAEVLGMEPPQEDPAAEQFKTIPDLYIYEQNTPDSYNNDIPEPMGYTVTNDTGKDISGYYALLSYWPVTSYYPPSNISPRESEFFRGQIIPMDLDLAQGESMKGEVYATAVGWPTMNHAWIEFESMEERDAFFSTDVLSPLNGSWLIEGYNGYEIDMGDAGIRWMKEMFGITITSGKY